MSKKHTQLATRLADILVMLNQNGCVDIKTLAEQFNVSTRTLQTDLNERLSMLDWDKAGPRIYSLKPSQLGVFRQEDIQRFANFASVKELFPQIDREFFQKSLNDSIKVKGVRYENISNRRKEFDLLQQAIQQHKTIEFSYLKKSEKLMSKRLLEPYILLNKNGIWYLIGLENGKQKTFSFTQIENITVLDRIFKIDNTFLAEIKNSDSISHGNQLKEVVIKVNQQVSPYFKQRNLLPNQEIISELQSGELLISCKNIHELEIVPLVQYWIPFLEIISPVELQNKMIKRLENYLGGN